jgi:hypothetical protein
MESAIGRCPHLGGAALGTLMIQANHTGETTENLARTLDTERIRNSELAEQIQKLRAELARVKFELKLERQGCFARPQGNVCDAHRCCGPIDGTTRRLSGPDCGCPCMCRSTTPPAICFNVNSQRLDKLQLPKRAPNCRRWRTPLNLTTVRKLLGSDTPTHRVNLICCDRKMAILAPRF